MSNACTELICGGGGERGGGGGHRQLHVWQSQVENEHYSVTCFDYVAVFEVLYL